MTLVLRCESINFDGGAESLLIIIDYSILSIRRYRIGDMNCMDNTTDTTETDHTPVAGNNADEATSEHGCSQY
jgi:hypothetical protein